VLGSVMFIRGLCLWKKAGGTDDCYGATWVGIELSGCAEVL